jgi:hypothetical protein
MDIEVTGIDQAMEIFAKLSDDLESLGNIASNPFFQQEAAELVAENESEVWATKGGAIGEDWDGNTLVDTGLLRGSMTNPSALRVRVIGNMLEFGSNVPYAGWVNDNYTFASLTPQKAEEAAELIERWLVSEGTLIWE